MAIDKRRHSQCRGKGGQITEIATGFQCMCLNQGQFNFTQSIVRLRPPFSKVRQQDSQTVIQPFMCFLEESSQFSVGQTAQSLTCSIIEKPHTGLDDCLRVQACFRKRMSDRRNHLIMMSFDNYTFCDLNHQHALSFP